VQTQQWQRRGKKEIHVHNFEDRLLAGKASTVISKIIDSTYQERMKYLFKGQKN